MNSKVFKGANVFMSRNLVAPELFDTLHDALKLNGAQVFLCCDPDRNSPNDYHIISSREHEKFESLEAKGCNLLGPHCVLTCAKEHRPLPNQGFTCCLAMDGVKVMASGFDIDEKVEIGKLVTGMGGVLQVRSSMNISFVIVKNVLAAKYKWALDDLKKPIVTKDWVYQCWKEHRVVPQDTYKVLPFTGLRICVSRIPAVERKEMEKVILQNGGRYSAELTRKCTHLVCDAPEGDKYIVAKQWGHIHIVTKKWFDQSLSRRACLNEESYPVQLAPASSLGITRKKARFGQETSSGIPQCARFSSAMASSSGLCGPTASQDPEVTVSHNVPSVVSDVSKFNNDDETEPPPNQPNEDITLNNRIANDSETEDNDLYLSECRIIIVGFDAPELRKLVSMVRRGGGSRYMHFNDKLTHIVVGSPSEFEIKETRTLAALGIIHVVKKEWLEDCDKEKKEFPVQRRHIAYDLILPKDPIFGSRNGLSSLNPVREGKSSAVSFSTEPEISVNKEISSRATQNYIKQSTMCSLNGKGPLKVQSSSSVEIEERKSSDVFKGRTFRFSPSFPVARRGEIIQWINEGGGQIVGDIIVTHSDFTVECHGVVPSDAGAVYVSSHWIKSSLEDGRLLDVESHILYSPLPCQIPFFSLEKFKLCISQYNEKERSLLKNLCFVLGTKFTEKLTKTVTHLLCKFASGPKYEASCKWGLQSVTAEWLYECIKQNKVIDPGPFHPKQATSQDREAGLCTMSQNPTQARQMISGDNVSQLPVQSEELKNMQNDACPRKGVDCKETVSLSSRRKAVDCKETVSLSSRRKREASEVVNLKSSLSSVSNQFDHCITVSSTKTNIEECAKVASEVHDDVAAIEDLLEQTSKINDHMSTGISLFPFDCSLRGQSSDCTTRDQAPDCSIRSQDEGDPSSNIWVPMDCTNRSAKTGDNINLRQAVATEVYDNFSETQTDSQVVGYAEDLSGRQMIIDRVRTRSSMT